MLYIDEEEMALRTMGKRLQRCFGNEIQVTPISPDQTIEKMIQKIESYHPVVSIVIDQKLFAAGTATYVGTQLAGAIRQTDHKIPIYILTNFVDDVDGALGDIEYVLAKDDLSEDNRLHAIAARLRRHINVFQDILVEREVRFEELLRKGYKDTLTAAESEEFQQLSFQRERKIAFSELLDSTELGRKLDTAQAALAKISNSLK
ncbi:hypothetical protein CFter6_0005 [Collimonas fungivorans]|uniref:Response regulator n=1 Tax=Collimonas fungivorans TaxID=158899 RepID=A0A127P4F8_9BURK|nr:hypothetical protein CFter6_0005 [Collimonas fungivorans]